MPPDDMMKGLVGDTNSMIASLIWGSVGTVFFLYGWKQKAMIPLFGGIAIIAGSYFFANSALLMSLFSIAAIAAIIWLKRRY
jgi:hypothetical protein